MGDFKTAYKKTGGAEGGYANVSGDRGGETYAGISRKNFPDWPGWEIVDAHKPLERGAFIKSDKLELLKESFYRETFWDKVHGDQIKDHKLAEEVYDTAVLSSVRAAIKMLQRSLGIKQTGAMDDLTLKTINI